MEFQKYFRSLWIAAPTHIQLKEEKVNEEYNQPLSDTFVRNPGKLNEQLGQGKDNKSQTQGCTVDHVIRYVNIDRQWNHVVRW